MTQIQSKNNFSISWREEFKTEKLGPTLIAGITNGVILLIVTLSLAALLFPGDLSVYLPIGFGIALFSSAVLAIMIALFSTMEGAVAAAMGSPAALIGLVVAGVSTQMAGADASPEQVLITVLVIIGISTILSGGLFLALGFFKLGGLVRYTPYPVIGGFLAGTGWLLFIGGFDVMAGVSLSFGTIDDLLIGATLVKWLPGFIFALALFFTLRRFKHFLLMPGMIVGAIALFYLVMLISGINFEQAESLGLIIGRFPKGEGWKPLIFLNVFRAQWGLIFDEIGNLFSIFVISLMSLLLTVSSLDLAVEEDIDLNHELKVAGIANLIAGLGGGIIGFQTISFSLLGRSMGAKSRLVGVVAGLICLVAVFVGPSMVAFMPNAVLGGLLMYLGLSFMIEWVYDAWFKLPRADYAVMILILVVIGLVDFIVGVGVGLFATIILFIINYSRVDVVKHTLSGKTYRSTVERPYNHQQLLAKQEEGILVLKLQGFLFFGTATRVLEQLLARVNNPDLIPLEYSVIDFSRVTGLDSSAVLSFQKGMKHCRTAKVMMVFTGVSEQVRHQLEHGELVEEEGVLRFFEALDYGVEWCEDTILGDERTTHLYVPANLRKQLKLMFKEDERIADVVDYLERIVVKEGEYLIRQGEYAGEIYFIELGEVTVQLELPDGQIIRLRKQGMGTTVGELNFSLGAERTASVIADMPCFVYKMSHEDYQKMQSEDPELAAIFFRYLNRILAERLWLNNSIIEALMK